MLQLSANISVTGLYTGQSKYAFWKNLNVGDNLVLSVKLDSPGRSSRGLYATTVNVKNDTQNVEFSGSITEISKYLSKIKYVE